MRSQGTSGSDKSAWRGAKQALRGRLGPIAFLAVVGVLGTVSGLALAEPGGQGNPVPANCVRFDDVNPGDVGNVTIGGVTLTFTVSSTQGNIATWSADAPFTGTIVVKAGSEESGGGEATFSVTNATTGTVSNPYTNENGEPFDISHIDVCTTPNTTTTNTVDTTVFTTLPNTTVTTTLPNTTTTTTGPGSTVTTTLPDTTVTTTLPDTTTTTTGPGSTVTTTLPDTTTTTTGPGSTVTTTLPCVDNAASFLSLTTSTISGSTVTNTQPGSTVTNTQPGSTVTNTQPGTTVTETTPGTTVTETTPGSTVTNTQPGSTVTNTQSGSTVTNTECATTTTSSSTPTTSTQTGGLAGSTGGGGGSGAAGESGGGNNNGNAAEPTQAVTAGSLPFTGLHVWLLVIVAVGMAGLGVALRRRLQDAV